MDASESNEITWQLEDRASARISHLTSSLHPTRSSWDRKSSARHYLTHSALVYKPVYLITAQHILSSHQQNPAKTTLQIVVLLILIVVLRHWHWCWNWSWYKTILTKTHFTSSFHHIRETHKQINKKLLTITSCEQVIVDLPQHAATDHSPWSSDSSQVASARWNVTMQNAILQSACLLSFIWCNSPKHISHVSHSNVLIITRLS